MKARIRFMRIWLILLALSLSSFWVQAQTDYYVKSGSSGTGKAQTVSLSVGA